MKTDLGWIPLTVPYIHTHSTDLKFDGKNGNPWKFWIKQPKRNHNFQAILFRFSINWKFVKFVFNFDELTVQNWNRFRHSFFLVPYSVCKYVIAVYFQLNQHHSQITNALYSLFWLFKQYFLGSFNAKKRSSNGQLLFYDTIKFT